MLSNATLRVLIEAAEEGLRTAESDAKEQIEGANDAVVSYTAAIAAAELYLSDTPTPEAFLAAAEITIELAEQNIIDRRDEPEEHDKQSAAIEMIRAHLIPTA